MKESKTIQVYPSDSKINAAIRENEAFGWELISNQRCREYEGQTYGIDGSTYDNYSTFNKLTFSREKEKSRYRDICKLENEYSDNKRQIERYIDMRPVEPKFPAWGVLLFFFYLLPGFIYLGVYSGKKSKYKKALKAYNEGGYEEKIRALRARQDEIFKEADSLIMPE